MPDTVVGPAGSPDRAAHVDREADTMIQMLTPEGERPEPTGAAVEYAAYVEDVTDDDLRGMYRDMVIVRRFDAGSYVALTDAMNTWDVGLARGGTEAALAAITTPLVVVAVDSDRLYPVADSRRIVDAAPAVVGGLRLVTSTSGHDGFLLEFDQIAPLVAETLALGRA